MEKLLLVTPPFVQVNCPYPATAYLSGYLRRRGFDVAQADLSVELIGTVFSRDFLERVFDLRIPAEDENLERIQAMRTRIRPRSTPSSISCADGTRASPN